MEGLDFFLTAICFSVLGYGLCYITLSSNSKLNTHNDSSENDWKDDSAGIHSYQPVRMKKYKLSIMNRQQLR